MADRQITSVERNDDGDIIGVCYVDGDKLRYVNADDAIAHIDEGVHAYFVLDGQTRTDVVTKHYLTTDPDPKRTNNLDALPGCERSK